MHKLASPTYLEGNVRQLLRAGEGVLLGSCGHVRAALLGIIRGRNPPVLLPFVDIEPRIFS